jgi:chromosomal replication initiator protein
MTEAQQIWNDTLEVVRSELNAPTFKTWFEHTEPMALIDHTLIVSVHNDFARDWLESRYSGLLRSALAQVSGTPLNLTFQVPGTAAVVDAPANPSRDVLSEETSAPPDAVVLPDLEEAEQRRVKEASEGAFNPKYTFDSFVIGESNRFAFTAAQRVAEAPSRAYNPLFIYGGAGLGKTHLLQAIGHYVRAHFPHMRVKYVSTEQFTNDFINSIANKDNRRTDAFRKQYRTNDVLLLDDVQFLMGKEGIQEEFFHTFNTLEQAGKQIILSSDRPPKDIATLEERLRSRFEMGLITDIQPPDLETRIAILKRKILSENWVVSDDVVSFIADRVSSNIRELEGSLIRIVAFSSLTRQLIDMELACAVLKDIFPERSVKPVSIASIQQESCKFYGISRAELIGSRRSQSVVYPRQIAMYLSRELTDISLPRIGAEFGGRDHTTVMHAMAKIQKLMNSERDVYNQIQTLTNLIKQKN